MSSNTVEIRSPSIERTMADVTPSPTPTPPSAKPSRLRRLWRWTKRLFLLFVMLLATTVIVYAIHRQLAFSGGREALAAVRAELDANEPGWRYEDIEAAYNATLPPPGKNSVEIVDRLPTVKIDEGLELIGRLTLDKGRENISNELPAPRHLEIADRIAAEFPASHPALRALAQGSPGGLPMVAAYGMLDSQWNPLKTLINRSAPLSTAFVAASARRDYKASFAYIRARLYAARAIGDMPRLIAQESRNIMAERAARMTIQMLAWGTPDEGLAELQREFLAEADRVWLIPTLRGERAVLDHSVSKITAIERKREFELRWNRKASWEDDAFLRVAEPYRDECLADDIRLITRIIGECNLPPQQRWQLWESVQNKIHRPRLDWPHYIIGYYRFGFAEYALDFMDRDTQTCSILRSAAAAIACERFRRVKNRWPMTLAEIPPDILTEVPADPVDGKPLRYRVIEGGAVVYYIGPPPSLSDEADVDFTSRNITPLWNVELRGKKPPANPDALPNNDPDEKP
jgi:hypothetical protein